MIHIIKRIVNKVLSLFLKYIVWFIPKSKAQTISAKEAESVLEQYSPNPNTTVRWDNCTYDFHYDLSIIIPVYNVEKYLEQCIESVINQETAFTYEIILINDCSPDNSRQIIYKYKEFPHIKIIEHDSNRGISGARNTGLTFAHGRYVMFVDSDDYISTNAVKSLMTEAISSNADIVQGGYYNISDISEKVLGKIKYTNCRTISPNGIISGMAWGKVYKAELFHQICFPEKYWFEDTVVTAILTHLAERIVTTEDMVYYYRKNSNSITNTSKTKPKSVDTYWVHRCVMEARKELGLSTDLNFYEHLLRMIILSYKRTEIVPINVKEAIFVLFRELLQSVRKSDFVVKRQYKYLEEAILDNDFNKYSFLCKWSFI